MNIHHHIRGTIIVRHGSISAWARKHRLNYQMASDLINGRKRHERGVRALIKDKLIQNRYELPQYEDQLKQAAAV